MGSCSSGPFFLCLKKGDGKENLHYRNVDTNPFPRNWRGLLSYVIAKMIAIGLLNLITLISPIFLGMLGKNEFSDNLWYTIIDI